MDRRSFLTTAALAAATTPLTHAARPPLPNADGGLIDTNVYLSHWVVRRSWAETPARLVEKLRHHGVTSAWTASFDGVLHTDIAGVNSRLAETCAREGGGILRAFGTVNPTLPDWEDDLRRCHEVHRMPGIRLFPNYHGYSLDDPRFARLLEICAQRELLVQISLLLEDERSHNPVLSVPQVQPAPLADLLPKIPRARVMLLNAAGRVLVANSPLVTRLVANRVSFDLATLEGIAGIEGVFQRTPDARLAFGSHSPYFYFEAALLKLQESALSPAQLAAVRHGHAQAALAAA